MDEQFFIDGNYIILYFLEIILKPENRSKTIDSILNEYNLAGHEHYILSPPLLISCLFGTFLIHQQKVDGKKKEVEQTFRKYFKVTKGNQDKIYKSIRNSIAHFNIDFREDGENPIIYSFRDKIPNKGFHFCAEIDNVNLRLMINELSKII